MANIVITGANRGIGLALAQQFAAQGDSVTAICRNSSNDIEDIADQVISGIDLTNEEVIPGVCSLVDQLTEGRVDCLINNAGLLVSDNLSQVELSDVRQQLAINTIAPLALTQSLLPLMPSGSKVINITSRMGSMDDNSSGGFYGYRASKAALNAIGKSLAVDLKEHGISVAQIHPGFVSTEMVNNMGEISPDEAAAAIKQRIEQLDASNTGTFWHANGTVLPW